MSMSPLKIRNMTLGDGMPKICISVTAKNKKELEIQTGIILESPFDMVEWRADYYEETEGEDWMEDALSCLRRSLGEKPLLFTFRTGEEGGERRISPEEYRKLNERAAASHFADLVDLEINRGEALFRSQAEMIHGCGVKVIGSFHDFVGTPDKNTIIGILCNIQKLGADISKAAVMPSRERDVLTLLDASLAMKETYADRPFITMSMSRLGSVSRLAGSLTGSALTFATAGRASAPGQLEAGLLSEILPVL